MAEDVRWPGFALRCDVGIVQSTIVDVMGVDRRALSCISVVEVWVGCREVTRHVAMEIEVQWMVVNKVGSRL